LTIPRIYSPEILENKNICKLTDDNARYLKNVLRLKPGARINVFDGFGHEFSAVLKQFCDKTVLLELRDAVLPEEKKINITLAQAIPKGRKMDIIVRSAAELGADKIIPFAAARSVGHIPDEKHSAKISRWQKIAMEAARSSHSSFITQVDPVSSFDDMIAATSGYAVKLIFWEEESQSTIKDILSDENRTSAKDYFLVVGPEGGFSKDEIIRSRQAGFISVSLGKQILKVETAAAAIITIIQYEKGIFSHKSSGGK